MNQVLTCNHGLCVHMLRPVEGAGYKAQATSIAE